MQDGEIEIEVEAVLERLDADIAAGRVETLPEDLVASMRRVLDDVDADFDTPIEGEVSI